ncbi:MAG TPA: hypothetical protein VHB70_18990 [Parafilimonas sp.]|nr:hypothetical protein [Parafilimonas sp.]
MDTKTFKVQLEIRFTSILDFRLHFKTIVSPYLKLFEFQIQNGDTYQERISLFSRDEGYFIDLRMDRMLLVSENRLHNFFEPSGPMYHFLKIFDKVKALESFNEMSLMLFAQWGVILKEGNDEKIQSNFIEKYFKEVPKPIDATLKDIGIQIDYVIKDEEVKLKAGPFVPEKDIKNFQLNSIASDKPQDYSGTTGLFYEIISTKKANDTDLASFKKMDKTCTDLLRKI